MFNILFFNMMSVGNHLDAVGYGYREKVSQGNVENEKMRWTYETN